MKYKKVLLVNPHIPKAYMGPIRPPIGLGYLAQYLSLHGVEYDILDMTLGYKLKDLLKRISDFRPDLIGVTVWTYMYKNTYRLIEAIKELKVQNGRLKIENDAMRERMDILEAKVQE